MEPGWAWWCIHYSGEMFGQERRAQTGPDQAPGGEWPGW